MAENDALAQIKMLEGIARDKIKAGEPEVDIGPFNLAQLRLGVAAVDEWGRIWRINGQQLVLVYKPEAE